MKSNPFAGCEDVLACPTCREPLALSGTSLRCSRNHCFDIARQGYVNLLAHHKAAGPYDRDSFLNRRAVFSSGLYDELVFALRNTITALGIEGAIVDAGCGEGFVSNRLADELATNAPAAPIRLFSFDICKDAVRLAAGADRNGSIAWFVADLASIPLRDHCARGVLNVFSPANYPEFRRVLGQGGFLIKAVPTAKHFHEIREQIGASAPERKDYSNERVLRHFSESCTMREHRTVTSTIHPTPAQLSAAVEMTPIMFGMDRASVNWASIDTLTMEAELLVGTFD